MEAYDNIASCLEVTDEQILHAMQPARSLDDPSPRQKMLGLLHRMAHVAAPESGASRMLLVAARMALRDWIDGDLVVRLIGDDDVTVMQLMVDDGFSMERMTAPLQITAPFEEFRQAVIHEPNTILPLARDGEIEHRGLTLRRTQTGAPKGPPSFSALDLGLIEGMGGRTTIERAPHRPPALPVEEDAPKAASKPPPLPKDRPKPPPLPAARSAAKQPSRPEPANLPPPKGKPHRLASYAKMPAIIEFPKDLKKKP